MPIFRSALFNLKPQIFLESNMPEVWVMAPAVTWLQDFCACFSPGWKYVEKKQQPGSVRLKPGGRYFNQHKKKNESFGWLVGNKTNWGRMAFPSRSGTTHSDIRASVLLCLYGRQVRDIHLEFYFHFLGIVTHGKNTRNLRDRCSGRNNRLQHKAHS